MSYTCTGGGLIKIHSITRIRDLSTVSSFGIAGYFMDNNKVIIVQFSDGWLYSFYFNGADIGLSLNSVRAKTGSSLLKSIVI